VNRGPGAHSTSDRYSTNTLAMFTSWWFCTYRRAFELRPRLVFTDGYKPDTRLGQGTADLSKHCLERYSLDHDFHLLQKGASRGLERTRCSSGLQYETP
jgi:hypothetical protein